MTGGVAGVRLPAADDRIHIGGVELEAEAAPARALGRDYGGATAEECVQHHFTPLALG